MWYDGGRLAAPVLGRSGRRASENGPSPSAAALAIEIVGAGAVPGRSPCAAGATAAAAVGRERFAALHACAGNHGGPSTRACAACAGGASLRVACGCLLPPCGESSRHVGTTSRRKDPVVVKRLYARGLGSYSERADRGLEYMGLQAGYVRLQANMHMHMHMHGVAASCRASARRDVGNTTASGSFGSVSVAECGLSLPPNSPGRSDRPGAAAAATAAAAGVAVATSSVAPLSPLSPLSAATGTASAASARTAACAADASPARVWASDPSAAPDKSSGAPDEDPPLTRHCCHCWADRARARPSEATIHGAGHAAVACH